MRSRVTKTAGIGVAAALVVAAGLWWAAASSPPSESTVTGSAVVVSSLACRNGDEGTVVDLRDPVGQPAGTTRRAILDSCGHQPGEVIAVAYSAADPSRLVVAATDPDAGTGRRLMPLAIVLAGLLALVAVVAVVRDGRRVTRPAVPAHPVAHGRHARPDEDEPAPPPAEPAWPVLELRPAEIDLLFPDRDRLAVSLHDELFTHRSPAQV